MHFPTWGTNVAMFEGKNDRRWIVVAGIIMADAYMARPDIIADGDSMNNWKKCGGMGIRPKS